jgi:hypothetical protein
MTVTENRSPPRNCSNQALPFVEAAKKAKCDGVFCPLFMFMIANLRSKHVSRPFYRVAEAVRARERFPALSPRPLFALGLLFVSLAPQIEAKHSKNLPEQQSSAQIEAAARLQIFLDRSNFSPGKIDGRYNEFTWKALALYRQSRGEQPQPPPPDAKSNVAPDLNGLDLGGVEPVFITYTVTQADLQNVGKLPASPKEQANLKALLYRDPADAIAEKFHYDIHFLEKLNPGKTKSIKPGDQLRVPNVEPFELEEVKDIKPGSEINAPAANELPDEPDKTPATSGALSESIGRARIITGRR